MSKVKTKALALAVAGMSVCLALGVCGCSGGAANNANSNANNTNANNAAAVNTANANNTNATNAASSNESGSSATQGSGSSSGNNGSTSGSTTGGGSSNGSTSGATSQEFVGSWELASVTEYGEAYSAEDLAIMKSSGMTVALTLNSDGTGHATICAKSGDCTWSASSSTQGSLTLNGETYNLAFDGGKLVLSQDDTQYGLNKTA